MMVGEKVEKWMRSLGLSYSGAGKLLGITAQSLHSGCRRGTFSRLVSHKLVALVPGLEHEDLLLPEERKEIRRLKRSAA